jgi:transposase
MDIAVLGVDLGKNVCSIVGLDASGAVVMRRRVRRETLIALAEKLAPCIVGMEACCGAHHLGRLFAAHGHDVRLMSPEYVRPYVKAQKNDDRDAEGIAEAATRPTMRFVELKSQDQLDMQTLHRSRDRLVGERTALINQLRAILLERGFIAPQGKRKLEQFLAVLMDEQAGAGLSPRMILLVADARAQGAELDRRIAAFDAEFVRWTKENEDARRLTTIPGFGAIVASALVASVGRAESFDRGRDLSAWLGIVPQQFTTGGKPKLLGISKRGNKYLRKQLIHGARAALPYVAERDTPLGRWAKALLKRAHRNVAVVAFANKLARIAWAVLRRGGSTTWLSIPFSISTRWIQNPSSPASWMTTSGGNCFPRARTRSWSDRSRTSSPPISPADTECFDIFSRVPGDSEVSSHVVRLNSRETKIERRSVRIEVFGFGVVRSAQHGRLQRVIGL